MHLMYNKSIFVVILHWIHTPAMWKSDIDVITVCMWWRKQCTGSFIAEWDNSTTVISTSTSRVKELECVPNSNQHQHQYGSKSWSVYNNNQHQHQYGSKSWSAVHTLQPTPSSKYLSYFVQPVHSFTTHHLCRHCRFIFPFSHFLVHTQSIVQGLSPCFGLTFCM